VGQRPTGTGLWTWRGCTRIAAIVLGLSVSANALAAEGQAGVDPDVRYTLGHTGFAARELVIDQGGREIARYGLSDCRLTSSETGAFPFFGGTDPAPVVAVLCGTRDGLRSLHVFAPASDPVGPVLAIRDRRSLRAGISHVGLYAGWIELGATEEHPGEIWEPNHGMAAAPRFKEARDAAIGKRIEQRGTLPEGLTPGPYVMVRDPDTPLRLGPSDSAPWFARAGGRLLIHLAEGEADGPGAVFWTVDGWARVCLIEGGCGYVPANAVWPLQ
jgi:hypothetical protein